MGLGGIIGKTDIGKNNGIDPKSGRIVHRFMPGLRAARFRERVDGHVNFGTSAMGIIKPLGQFVTAEVEAGEVAGVGFVAKPQINHVTPRIHGGAQGSGSSRRANEFELMGHASLVLFIGAPPRRPWRTKVSTRSFSFFSLAA